MLGDLHAGQPAGRFLLADLLAFLSVGAVRAHGLVGFVNLVKLAAQLLLGRLLLATLGVGATGSNDLVVATLKLTAELLLLAFFFYFLRLNRRVGLGGREGARRGGGEHEDEDEGLFALHRLPRLCAVPSVWYGVLCFSLPTTLGPTHRSTECAFLSLVPCRNLR